MQEIYEEKQPLQEKITKQLLAAEQTYLRQQMRYRKVMKKLRYDGAVSSTVDDVEALSTMKEYSELLEKYTEECLLEGRMQEAAGGYAQQLVEDCCNQSIKREILTRCSENDYVRLQIDIFLERRGAAYAVAEIWSDTLEKYCSPETLYETVKEWSLREDAVEEFSAAFLEFSEDLERIAVMYLEKEAVGCTLSDGWHQSESLVKLVRKTADFFDELASSLGKNKYLAYQKKQRTLLFGVGNLFELRAAGMLVGTYETAQVRTTIQDFLAEYLPKEQKSNGLKEGVQAKNSGCISLFDRIIAVSEKEKPDEKLLERFQVGFNNSSFTINGFSVFDFFLEIWAFIQDSMGRSFSNRRSCARHLGGLRTGTHRVFQADGTRLA